MPNITEKVFTRIVERALDTVETEYLITVQDTEAWKMAFYDAYQDALKRCIHCGEPVKFHWWADNEGGEVHTDEDHEKNLGTLCVESTNYSAESPVSTVF